MISAESVILIIIYLWPYHELCEAAHVVLLLFFMLFCYSVALAGCFTDFHLLRVWLYVYSMLTENVNTFSSIFCECKTSVNLSKEFVFKTCLVYQH